MTQLLEREHELRQLREVVAEAAGRHGAVVLVTGEAGIGKSTLLREWTENPGADARVLVGSCDDFLTSRTLGPFHDIARETGGQLADAVTGADTGAVLDLLLAELDNPLRPTVVVLEDAHWADEATLDVVRYVGRRIGALPAVLAITFRDDEVGSDHPLTGVLGVLPSKDVHRIPLRPLSRAAIATLTEGTGLDPTEVLRSTGGNPFFVTEVARADHGVPASVADAVLARLRSLPAGARDAVEVLSVIPRPVPRVWVEGLVSSPEVLSPAEERGVLVLADGDIGFRHELARQAVLQSLPAVTRLHHHERVLGHLLETDGDADSILRHAVEAGRADIVLAHGPAVAHEAFHAGAHRQAIVHQDNLLRYGHLLADAEHAGLLEEHAWSLYNLHRFEAARVAADRAVELRTRGTDVPARARSVLTAARMAYMTNRPERCLDLIAVAADLADEIGDHEIEAEVRVNRTAMLHLSDHHAEAEAEGRAALELVSVDERPDVHVLAHVYRGGARFFLGEPDAGLQELRDGIDLGLATNQVEPAARGYTNLVEFLAACRRWEDTESTSDEALSFYDDHDLPAHRFNTHGQLAHVELWRGRWEEADRAFQELDDMHVEGVLAAILLGGRALLAVRRGDEDAGRAVHAAWDLALAGGQDWYLVHAACAALEHAWAEQDPRLADPYVVPGLEAAGERFWAGWVHWRLEIIGRRPDTGTDLPDGPERTSIRDGWRAGADAWDHVGMPYERALDLLRSNEEGPMREALEIFDDLGAAPAGRIARQRLRELGVRGVPRGPQVTTQQNPAGLTDRQLEVLLLVSEGLTNAEIAERLVVSVRTVDHHVSAILQKLGVTSRQEAADHAQRMRRS